MHRNVGCPIQCGTTCPEVSSCIRHEDFLEQCGRVGAPSLCTNVPNMAKRWQMVVDGLGAAQPPFRHGALLNLRMRFIAHNLAKTLLERTIVLAEKTGGFGARQLRTTLDSPLLFGASRVEDPLTLLGHALWMAVGVAARQLSTSARALIDLCSRALPL